MVFHRARPWRARRPAFGTRAGTRLRGTPSLTLTITAPVPTPQEMSSNPARASISVLGVRRRYWELLHGWHGPPQPRGDAEIEEPGRVA